MSCKIRFPDHSPQDNSPHGQLTPRTTHPIKTRPTTTRPMDNSPHGQLAPGTTRPMDNSPHGQLAPRTTRPMTTRPITYDKKNWGQITLLTHISLAQASKAMDNSPHGQLAPLAIFYIYSHALLEVMGGGGGVKNWGILILKTHISLTSKETWVWFHIYVCTKYIMVQKMCTFFNPSCASSLS